jgi:predicted nucleic acid-binding protein
MIEGCKNRREYQYVEKFLADFRILSPTEVAFQIAVQRYAPFSLSHGVGYMDILIAALATELNLTLISKNLKHFQPLLDQQVVRPY